VGVSALRGTCRVVLVDDNPDVIESIRALLEYEADIDVIGVANDADEANDLIERTHPDVALVDVSMPKGGGVRVTKHITAASPGTAILIFSGAGDTNAVLEMLRLGAAGFIQKAADPGLIIDAIRATARGVTVLSGNIASRVARELARATGLDERARARQSRLVEKLLSEQAFRIQFQPIVELSDLSVMGFEALTHFDQGTPEEWFERAWRVGRGPELEIRVIELALALLPALPPRTYLSLNISPDVIAHRAIREVLQQVDASRIVLEITEHAAIEDVRAFQSALRSIRDLGVKIAVDDAGAGFGNFVRLLQVVPDIIKIDRVLVRDVDRDRVKVAAVRSLIALSMGIGAQIVGEGIERPEEARRLSELGVRWGQGYLFGRPSDAADAVSIDLRGQR
jgi:EAL domain-containing protein (putative c-di-GMP-specific phosphodiesterase class I)/ActR/RegA family two-component response regulator